MRRLPPAWPLLAVATASLLLPASPTHAQTPSAAGWVGRRVITTLGTPLRDGATAADTPPGMESGPGGGGRQEFRVYKVERIEGDRLRVVSESGTTRGWILAVEAIPIENAVAHFTARIAANPSDADNFANRAVVWAVLGDLDRALLDGTEAIRLDPGSAMAYHNRGYAWAKKKDLDRAVADFTRAIELDPQYARAYNKRGFAWLEKRAYARAAADFSRAIAIDPKFARAYHNRGNAMARQKDFEKAIDDYTQAIRLDAYDALAFVDRASVEHVKGDDDRALADLSEAIRREPDSVAALVDRAWLLATSPSEKVRDGKQAVADATRACALTHGKEAYSLGALAAALAERGDFDQAAKYQERAQPLYRTRDDVARGRVRLDLYRSRAPYREPAASSLARPEGNPLSPSAMGHAPRHEPPAPGGRGV